jgi:hypothetical protein
VPEDGGYVEFVARMVAVEAVAERQDEWTLDEIGERVEWLAGWIAAGIERYQRSPGIGVGDSAQWDEFS